jgi:hypothetical protein
VSRTTRIIVLGFVAGAVGVLVFHQGVLLILHALGLVPFAAYSFQPTKPLGVPTVLSLAFWGGLWGIALVALMERVRRADSLWVALIFGGLFPPLVAALVVTPLKGGDMARWTQPAVILIAFLINGAWGLGTALAYRAARAAIRETGEPGRLDRG